MRQVVLDEKSDGRVDEDRVDEDRVDEDRVFRSMNAGTIGDVVERVEDPDSRLRHLQKLR